MPIEFGEWAVARKTRHHGVTVGLFLLGDQSPLLLLERVTNALDLIAEVDPRRYRRLQHDDVRLLVEDGPMCQYLSMTNTCVLSLDAVQNRPREQLALAIIHEAAHARLYRAGVGFERKHQARQERCCVLEQIDFLRRLGALGYIAGQTHGFNTSRMRFLAPGGGERRYTNGSSTTCAAAISPLA